MKIKKALLKDSFKEIKKSYKRFISILLMALLGVGFFAGLRATSPDMVNSLDSYYKTQNFYDIEVISTLGLTNSDVEQLSKIEDVDRVYGTYSKDGIIQTSKKEVVSKILCIDEVNKPVLIEGEMPKNVDECLVEKSFLKTTNKKIGDYIEIEPEKVEGETEYLKNKKLKIVGIAQSPLYISRERGSTKLGTGTINYYTYVNKENVNSEVYTEIYIRLKDSNKYQTSSSKYEDYVKKTKDEIEKIKEERENARYQELINEANQEIAKAENEFNIQKKDAQTQIQDAENKIANAKKEIEKAENEINSNEAKAKREFANAETKIKNAEKEIEKSEKQLNESRNQAVVGINQAENQKKELQNSLNKINPVIELINNQIKEKQKELQEAKTEEERNKINKEIIALQTALKGYSENKKQIQEGIIKIEQQVSNINAEIKNAETKINTAKAEIVKQKNVLRQNKNNTNNQIKSGRGKIENSRIDIANAEAELQKSKAEFDVKIHDAEGKLIDAKEKVSEIEKAKWYILDRQQNAGYNSYIQDTKSIKNLSAVFPIVFFAIAILVSLTSMTRMVEEQRQEIGTLKALGYNKFHIMQKYLIYSSLACIIGGIIGMNIGLQLLPRIIWDMYEMMYTLPEFIVSFNYEYSSMGLGLIYICIVGATLYTILKEIKQTPANLLRPKAPKYGKRVLLERINFIWKRLKFTHKVTVRNIFRYKKRFLMTIIGIMGCTSLILAGFGLKDSISIILPEQYENIFNYDLQASLKTSLTQAQRDEYINKLKQKQEIKDILETYMEAGTARKRR